GAAPLTKDGPSTLAASKTWVTEKNSPSSPSRPRTSSWLPSPAPRPVRPGITRYAATSHKRRLSVLVVRDRELLRSRTRFPFDTPLPRVIVFLSPWRNQARSWPADKAP